MPSYRVTYFDARGRAELARLCLAHAGQEFEDRRVAGAEWGELKPNTTPPYLPTLEVDGLQLGESCMLAQYVAQKYGFGGDSDEDKHIITSYVYYIDGLLTKMVTAHFEKDEERKKSLQEEVQTKVVPELLTKCESIVSKNGAGVLHGSKISTADIHFYNILFLVKKHNADVLASTPALSALYDKVANEPKMAAWIAKRPESEF